MNSISIISKAPINVMIDLETLGVRPGNSILQLGACAFDLPSDIIDIAPFSEYISRENSRELGFVEDDNTIAWWDKQSEALREKVFSGELTALSVIYKFNNWLEYLCSGDFERLLVWSKGTDFDISILAAYYDYFDLPAPWKYNNVRDYRTLAKLFPQIIAANNPVPHDACCDAIAQAKHAETILSYLRSKI